MNNRNSIGCLGLVLIIVVGWFLLRIASLQSEQAEAARAAQARAAAEAARPPVQAEPRPALLAAQLRQALEAHQQIARVRLRGGDGALEGTWTVKEVSEDGAVLQSMGGDSGRLVLRLDALLTFVVLEPIPQLEH